MKSRQNTKPRRVDDARWFLEHQDRRYRVRPSNPSEGPVHPDAGGVVAFYLLAPMLLVHVFGVINPRLLAEPAEAKAKAAFDAFAAARGLTEAYRDLEDLALAWGAANGLVTRGAAPGGGSAQ